MQSSRPEFTETPSEQIAIKRVTAVKCTQKKKTTKVVVNMENIAM